MNRQEIPLNSFNCNIIRMVDDGLLLTAGDFNTRSFNSMTISWGSIGFIWGRPLAQVFVHPSRYTYEFMEKYDSFTITAIPGNRQGSILTVLGTKSGRNMDKINHSGLTPIPSVHIPSPTYEEAELTVECRKICHADFHAEAFAPYYREEMKSSTYHRAYLGEVVGIYGIDKYRLDV